MTVVLQYVKNLSENIKRILHYLDIIFHLLKKGVVYQIACMACTMVYIGLTGWTLKHRLIEHHRALKLLDTNTSAVAQHAIQQHLCIDWGIMLK